MIGDLAGQKVRVANPSPENEEAFGVVGVARHAKSVEQGGLPLDEETEKINEQEVSYYVDADSPESEAKTSSRTFSHSELEPLD